MAASPRATASCSRASACRSRARTARASPRSTPDIPGVDPYTTAVSDVYQDLFGEGSFTGKGIYDVDAFERATHGRFAENTLLSHDLIEGAFARAGLVTDIELYDDYPTRYLTYTRRKHRWIRGDWQILRWLGGTVPGPGRARARIGSRRSRGGRSSTTCGAVVVEISQLLLLVAGWIVLPGSAIGGPASCCCAIAFPWLSRSLLALAASAARQVAARVLRRGRARRGTSAQQFALAVAFLPHQAWVSADAIVRTLCRLLIRHRILLEWQTASQAERDDGCRVAARDVAQDVAGHCSLPRRVASADRPSRHVGAASTRDRAFLFVTGRCRCCWLWLAARASRFALSAPAILGELAAHRRRATGCAAVRASALGCSSRSSSRKRRTGWRRTTSRKIPSPSSRCARRRRTSGSSCSPS